MCFKFIYIGQEKNTQSQNLCNVMNVVTIMFSFSCHDLLSYFLLFFPVTRKEMISTGVLSLKDDWKLSGVVLSKHPRSAETFAHRYTCVSNCYKQKQ